MVSKLEKLIRRLRARWRSRIHFAFGWPKDCAGWKDAALRPLIRALPYSAVLDGCACGVRSVKNSRPIKKPWRIITDYFPPQPGDLQDVRRRP